MRFTALMARCVAVMCLAAVVAVVPAAAQKAGKGGVTASFAGTVVVFPSNGNVTCADLNADNAQFPTIVEDYEVKLDPPPPTGASSFNLASGGGAQLGGGFPSSPQLTLNVNVANQRELQSFQLVNTTSPYYLISAVIVKGGNQGTNVYYYPGLIGGDTGPFTVTGGKQAISHISFCLQPIIGPSAADSSVSGVVQDGRGRAIAGAQVQLFSLSTGEARTALSNSFGYYRFDAVETGDAYIVTATAPGYTFPSATVSPQGDLTVNFVAN